MRACEDAAKAADAAAMQQRRVFEGMLRDANGSFRIAFERLREEQTRTLQAHLVSHGGPAPYAAAAAAAATSVEVKVSP